MKTQFPFSPPLSSGSWTFTASCNAICDFPEPKEFELEVMRDLNDNVVIICSIENFDPMGWDARDVIDRC
jgi:hypothetical protein